MRDGNDWYYYSSKPSFLEPANLDVISGSSILVTVERPTGSTALIPSIQATYQSGTTTSSFRVDDTYRTSTAFSKLFYRYTVSSDLPSYSSYGVRIAAQVIRQGELFPIIDWEGKAGNGYVFELIPSGLDPWNGGTYTIAAPSDTYPFVQSYSGAEQDARSDDVYDQ